MYNYNLKVHEIIDLAASRAADSNLNGEQLRKYRQALNLLLRSIVNKGYPLALMERHTVTTSLGQSEYPLSVNIKDVHTITVKSSVSNSVEFPLTRYGTAEFQTIPTKSQRGRPTIFSTERRATDVNLRLWPTPNQRYSVNMFAFTKPRDIVKYTDTLKIDERYLPAIIAGLAYKIGIIEEVPLEKISLLKKEYDEELMAAHLEDRERTSYKISPGVGMYGP